MSDPRNSIDAWLNAEVEPLAPPPGTFERVRRRARRHKANRALMSAAGVVIVIAAAVAVPRVAGPLLQVRGQAGPSVAAGAASPSTQPQATGQGNGSLNANSGTKVTPPTSSLSPGGSGNPVPANFQPTSVTFIGGHIRLRHELVRGERAADRAAQRSAGRQPDPVPRRPRRVGVRPAVVGHPR